METFTYASIPGVNKIYRDYFEDKDLENLNDLWTNFLKANKEFDTNGVRNLTWDRLYQQNGEFVNKLISANDATIAMHKVLRNMQTKNLEKLKSLLDTNSGIGLSDSLERLIDEGRNKIITAKKELETVMEEIEKLKQNRDALAGANEIEVKRLEEEIQRLENEMEAANNANSGLQEELRGKQAEIAALERELAEAKQQGSEQKEQIEQQLDQAKNAAVKLAKNLLKTIREDIDNSSESFLETNETAETIRKILNARDGIKKRMDKPEFPTSLFNPTSLDEAPVLNQEVLVGLMSPRDIP